MLISQLLFCATVILISNVAQAQPPEVFLATAESTKTSKQRLETAHELNKIVRMEVENLPGKPGRRILTDAGNLIKPVLAEKNQTEILRKLKKVLGTELRALSKVNASCIKNTLGLVEGAICETACVLIELAILNLIDAIIKAETDESRKIKVVRLRKKFFEEDFHDRSKIPNHIIVLVRGVLKAMKI